MKIFIGIVNYNRSCFLREQIARINRYLLHAKDDRVNICIADNSTNKSDRDVNENLCKELGLFYMDCDFNEGDPSLHHSLALNLLNDKSLYEENDISLFLDHDTFLFAPSNIIYTTIGKNFAGIGQNKVGKVYLHPNCLVINNALVPREVINLSPCEGMDTGGRLSDYIATLINSQINWVSFGYGEYNYEGTNDMYEIIDGSFMHFVKGSNWNRNPRGQQRQDALLAELQKISK